MRRVLLYPSVAGTFPSFLPSLVPVSLNQLTFQLISPTIPKVFTQIGLKSSTFQGAQVINFMLQTKQVISINSMCVCVDEESNAKVHRDREEMTTKVPHGIPKSKPVPANTSGQEKGTGPW